MDLGIMALVRSFELLVRVIRENFASALLTIMLLVVGYVGAGLLGYSNGLLTGYRVTLVSPDSIQLRNLRAATEQAAQASLVLTTKTDAEIHIILALLIADAPQSAVRAGVALVHDGVFSPGGMHLMKYSLVNAAAKSGYVEGALTQDMPLSQMSDYLPRIVTHPSCTIVKLVDMLSGEARESMAALGIRAFTACSIFNARGIFLGALLLSYIDDNVAPPNDPIYIRQLSAASAIGVLFDLRESK